MKVTLDIPEELVRQLTPWRDQMPQILERGLRAVSTGKQDGYSGVAEILEFLAGLPTPEETIALRPSPALQSRISELLTKNRSDGLTPGEEQEWRQYEYLTHLVRIAKAKAYIRLQTAGLRP